MNEIKRRRILRRLSFIQPILFYGQVLFLAYTLIKLYLDLIFSPSFSPIQGITIIISFVSFSFWALARIQLGDGLTFLPLAGKKLVTHGLYRYFRNPIYYFGVIGMISYFILIDYYPALWSLVVIIPVQIIRSLRERVVLKRKFDDEYEEYERKLWF